MTNNEDKLLEFYYPISSTTALLIAVSNERQRVECELKMDSEIIGYNNLLLDMEHDFVFALREEPLTELIKSF